MVLYTHGHWITFKIGENDVRLSISCKYLAGHCTQMNKSRKKWKNAVNFCEKNWVTISIFMVISKSLSTQSICWITSIDWIKLNLFQNSSNRPTELDALVFGHIFSIMTTKLPNNDLQQLIRNNFTPLIKLCQRIEQEYFGNLSEMKNL